MNISETYIQHHFKHVFNNEFNSRKILHSFIDKAWGSYLSMQYCMTTNDFQWRGRDYYMEKCKLYRQMSRTIVLTEDKDGKVELFAFWLDFNQSYNCYGEINLSSKLHKEPIELSREIHLNRTVSCNAVKKYFV